jgi:hypothetical protein
MEIFDKNHALYIIECELTNILDRSEIAISYKADSLGVSKLFSGIGT